MIATQKFSCTIFCTPEKDIWCQESITKRFAKTINSFYPLTIFAKCSILDVWQSSEYAPAMIFKLR